MSIDDLGEVGVAMNDYKGKFGEMPPIFGYPEDEILPAIKKALDTGVAMPGLDEVIEEELDITETDRGKVIIV